MSDIKYVESEDQARHSLKFHLKQIGFLGMSKLLYDISREQSIPSRFIVERFQELTKKEQEKHNEDTGTGLA